MRIDRVALLIVTALLIGMDAASATVEEAPIPGASAEPANPMEPQEPAEQQEPPEQQEQQQPQEPREPPEAAQPPHSSSAISPVRTLADVPIEAETPVPEVLFITGRDTWRSLEFATARYLPSALDVAGGAPLPEGIWLLIVPGEFDTVLLK